METLTTMEKIMNMTKLGIVSRFKTAFYSINFTSRIKGMPSMLYTLCAQSAD